MSEIVKICKVHGNLLNSQTYYRKNGDGIYYYRCKECSLIRERTYRKHIGYKRKYTENDRIKMTIRKRKFRKESPEKVKANDRKYRTSEKGKIYVKRQQKKYSDRICKELHPTYIKNMITMVYKLSRCDIPVSLVEVHAALLKLKRKLRELKDGNSKDM